ncbi:P-loop containing nucleoside triphosphate hydrolase protein, partial [Trichocladium antarcticum]
FQPRQSYEVSASIPRSYFLGHHHAALSRMRQGIANIGLIIECRDFRVPLTSWNPLLEQSLASSPAERARIIVYTKRDLGPDPAAAHGRTQQAVRHLRDFHLAPGNPNRAADVLFLGTGPDHSRALQPLLQAIKAVARQRDSLTGMRALVVGMPNAGKSTLLNRLRGRGMGLPKAARTGSEPGVTRRLGTPVRIVLGEGHADGEPGMGEGVFVVDTPGVFMPYVSDPEAMMKLALVGSVRDGLVSRVAMADYLLYHLNRAGLAPEYMARFNMGRPTNDVHEFLWAVGKRTGKLAKGGEPSLEAAADWAVQQWRKGELGRLLMDEVTPERLARAMEAVRDGNETLSMNQAVKKEKVARKARRAAKRLGLGAPE